MPTTKHPTLWPPPLSVDVRVDTALLDALCQATGIEGLALPADAPPQQRQIVTNNRNTLAVEMAMRSYVRAINAARDVLNGGR